MKKTIVKFAIVFVSILTLAFSVVTGIVKNKKEKISKSSTNEVKDESTNVSLTEDCSQAQEDEDEYLFVGCNGFF